jgi:hypothetical protein
MFKSSYSDIMQADCEIIQRSKKELNMAASMVEAAGKAHTLRC